MQQQKITSYEIEKSKTSVVRLLYIGALGLTIFFSIALISLSINFPVKLNVILVFVIAILLLLLTVLLTFKKKYNSAKFLFVLIPSYTVFFVSILTKVDGILDNALVYLAHRFFTLTFLIAPVIFFGLENRGKMLLSFLLLMPIAVFFDFVHEFFGVDLSNLVFDPSYYRFFNFMVILIYSFAIISVLLFQQTAISFKRKIVRQSMKIGAQEKTLRQTLTNLDASINHAKFIQTALIPNQNTLNSYFDDMSSLFIPRDQVSGDFYYANKVGSAVYFGLGDCTGHGVPGAFIANMSIQSILLLLDREKGLIMPDVLLTSLRKIALQRVVNMETNLTDSMDAGACLYDEESNTLYFSGGFINLLLLRNNRELIELKGTKCPVGSYPVYLPYELHSMKIQKGDIVYLTSDGYYDQFGVDEESIKKKVTKFKKHRFKDLIISNSHLSSQEQTRLLEDNFYSWKGNEDQIDDVTVLIIKF